MLDQPESQRLADAAFEDALEQLAAADRPAAVELIAAYTAGALRGAVRGVHAELRSRGQTEPRLPPLAPAPDLEAARADALAAARRGRGGARRPSPSRARR